MLARSVPEPSGQARSSAYQEWRANWQIVLVCLLGMSFTAIAPNIFGLFMDSFTHDFGWSRAQISVGFTVTAIIGLPLTPVTGLLCDRFGPRAVAIPGIIANALGLAAFGLTNGSVSQWIGLWAIYSLTLVSVKTIIWTAAVSSVFTAQRGLALAITLSGVALSQTAAPLLTEWLIEQFGWRLAFFILGGSWGGLVSLLVVVLLRVDSSPTRVSKSVASPKMPRQSAMTGVRRVLSSPVVYKISAISFILSTLSTGIVVHKVPLLAEIGVDRETAVQIAASAGVAGIAGKLLLGWLFDRSNSRYIGVVGLGLNGLGAALLLVPNHSNTLNFLAMLIIGAGSGASLQIIVYLATRYMAVSDFGKSFGVVSSFIALGAGIGPVVAGWAFEATGSYMLFIASFIPGALVSGLLALSLGPFPDEAA